MKRTLLIALALAGVYTCKSQTVTPVLLSNEGGFAAVTNGDFSWSIGEPVSETFTTVSNVFTMGFHQPELSVVNLMQEQSSAGEVLVYPNPVKETLNVSLSGLAPGAYKLELCDAIGKLISSEDMNLSESNNTFQMRMTQLAAGNYFLRVSGQKLNKAVKITKVQ